MREIPLTKGYVALVDDEDFSWLSQWKWHAHFSKKRYSTLVYAARNVSENGKRRPSLMHREILGTPKGVQTDHKNGNTLDNQRHNLRQATHGQNSANSNPRRQVSPFKGIGRVKNHWRASVTHNGIKVNCGYFKNPEDAARAYDAKAREIHGEFARTNFSD